MKRTAKPLLRFNNRTALFLWGFAVFFMWFSGAMAYLVFRDGPPPNYPPLLVEALVVGFCLVGLSLGAWAGKQPCYRLDVYEDGRVRTRIQFPFKSIEKFWIRRQLPPAMLIETKDSESDPYFHGRLTLPDGTLFQFIEGHDRETCQIACEKLNAFLENS